MSALTLAAVHGDEGLRIRISLDEPVQGGALLLSVTGTAGRLIAQQRLELPVGADTLDHLIDTDDSPLRLKAVLVLGDEVLAHARADLHISLTACKS